MMTAIDRITILSDVLLYIVFATSIIIFFVLFFVTAPYGRHLKSTGRGSKPEGILLSRRLGWLFMELPAVTTIFLIWFFSEVGIVGLIQGKTTAMTVLFFSVFLIIWESHYIYRAFIDSFLSGEEHNNFKLYVVITGFCFNIINGFLNGWFLFYRKQGLLGFSTMNGENSMFSYFLRWNFVIGLLIFIMGFIIHLKSDRILREVKRKSAGQYGIPNSFLHRYIASPNYLGEIIQWWGWALLTMSWAAVCFAFFTMANLVPRAFSNLKWYRQHFSDYPVKRKAIFPFII